MRTTSTQISAFFHQQEYPLVTNRGGLDDNIRCLLGSNQSWIVHHSYTIMDAWLESPALDFWNQFLKLHRVMGHWPIKIDEPVSIHTRAPNSNSYFRIYGYLGATSTKLDWQFYLKEAHRIARKTGNTGLMRDWAGNTFWG